jgi:hypothetical protein
VASPLLVSLTVPDTKFSSKEYEIREIVGGIAPIQLALIKKGVLTEKHLGTSNDENVNHLTISGLRIINTANDTTRTIITSDDENYEVTFYK